MGVTIHYRGRLEDLSRVEAFEDRVIDVVLRLGGDVNIWRSLADDDPERILRGLIVDLAPGQETMSLVVSPEGWLVSLFELEEAERGEIKEPSYCFVKTQYGPVEGHAALVELLAVIQREFIPDLEVHDEAGYWEHRDPRQLAELMARNQRMIDAFADAIGKDSLSPEAAEDPEILATRIMRIAKKVHGELQQEGGFGPPAESLDDADTWPREEAEWDEIDRENRARQQRMERTIEEELLRGETPEQALETAMDREFSDAEELEDCDDEPPDDLGEVGEAFAEGGYADQEFADEELNGEPWRESVLESQNDFDREFKRKVRDPLLQRATDLLMVVRELRPEEMKSPADDPCRHACEICGGLAQVLPMPPAYDLDDIKRGICVTQLKRALRGAAFLRGVLFNIRRDDPRGPLANQLREEVEAIQTEIVGLLKLARPEPQQ